TIEDAVGNTVNDGADSSLSVTFAKDSGAGTVTGLAASSALSGEIGRASCRERVERWVVEASVKEKGGPITTATADKLTFAVVHGSAQTVVLIRYGDVTAVESSALAISTIEDAVGNTVNDGADSSLSVTFAKDSGAGTVTGLAASSALSG